MALGVRQPVPALGPGVRQRRRGHVLRRPSHVRVVPRFAWKFAAEVDAGVSAHTVPSSARSSEHVIGREATKRLDEFKKLPKTYVATLHLGAVSDTYDVTGKIRNMIHDTRKTIHNNNETAKQWSNEKPNEKQILFTLESFKGKQLQTPPMHSAKKVGGVRLYKLARQGKEIEREAVPIEMYDIKLLEYEWPRLKIEVTCSAGTYIRSLANDIGEKLGVGAYCEALTRTKIGDYTLEQAHELAAVDRLFS